MKNSVKLYIIIGVIILIIIGIVVYINQTNSNTQKKNMINTEYSNFIAEDKNNIKIYQGDSLDFSYKFEKDSILKEIKLITSGNLSTDSNHNGYALIYKNDNIINIQANSFFTSNIITEFKIPLGNDTSFKAGDIIKIIWNVKTGTSNNNSFYVYYSTLENTYILPVIINYDESL